MNAGLDDRITVSELVRSVDIRLQQDYSGLSVEGELSNVSRPASGHIYGTLKDSGAQLRFVMWRSVAASLRFRPELGQAVIASGKLAVYPARGDLQLIVQRLELAGVGALQAAFEALRDRLNAEGLFDPARKQRPPAIPDHIGIVTSGTGAALRDMITVLGRRFPAARVTVCPVLVQGDGAARSISRAIRAFNSALPGSPDRPDVLIVGRGGGSLEDLWAFNEETTARAIHASGIPIISGVGHETDVTIADYVADVRAATPSQAAEFAVPQVQDVTDRIRGELRSIRERLRSKSQRARQRVHAHLDSRAMHIPQLLLNRARQQVDEASSRMDRATMTLVTARIRQAEAAQHRLRALDPLRPLRSGFALVQRHEKTVYRANDLKHDDRITLQFADGRRQARVDDEI